MAIVRCGSCDGYVSEGEFSTIRFPALTPDGRQRYDEAGEAVYDVVRLPRHAIPHSRFDPSGIGPASCDHGLKEHPDPRADRQTAKYAVSWARTRYLDAAGRCPICRGEPAPADLLLPRAAE